MPQRFVAIDDALRVREEAKGFTSYVFFGDRELDGDGPQMYMNLVDPANELVAHFHRVDQFQVFFGTPGSVFQRRPVPSLMVHYTDAYTPYGPFSSSPDEPLMYATIRARSSNYGGIMPGANRERPYRGTRQRSAQVDAWEVGHDVAVNEVETRQLFDEATDGLAATLVRLGPDTSVELQDRLPISGRAFCILDGELRTAERTFGPRSLGWRGPDEAGSKLQAGTVGCSLLVLDFGFPASTDRPHDEQVGSSPTAR